MEGLVSNMSITRLDHPKHYRSGVRVLFRTSRAKDDALRRAKKTLVSRNSEEFEHNLNILASSLRDGERIYGSVDARNYKRAIYHFREKQLAIECGSEEYFAKFYFDIERVWQKSLQANFARETKNFLWDLDTEEEFALFHQEILTSQRHPAYIYRTKNGHHAITAPFNTGALPEKLRDTIHRNSSMLWAYS